MNRDLLLVLALLGGCIALFVANRPRMDVVALLVLTGLPLTGVLSPAETLAGFGDPIIILIAALFVLGAGLVRTGVAYRLSDLLAKRAGSSETRLVVLLMISVALLGSVMSSTGVVAIFIPVALSLARRFHIPPGRLLMPLSFAGLISGMLTLVATPPNLVVDGALKQQGHAGLGFFSLTPIGITLLILAIGYMVAVRRRLVRPGQDGRTSLPGRDFSVLIEEYRLSGREHRLRIEPGSPLLGRPLGESDLRNHHDFNVVAVERARRMGTALIHPDANTELRAGDTLFVDMRESGQLTETCRVLKLTPRPLSGNYFSDQSRQVGMAEVAIPPESTLSGRTVREIRFRSRHGLQVVGLRRDRKALDVFLADEKIRTGDTLLVIGPWKAIRRLHTRPRDFLVLSLPAESAEAAPAADRAPHALLALCVMIVLMITGAVPNVTAALIACLMMGLFGCIDMPSAYRSIHWQSLVLIAGMMPFAVALERTGGVELAVNSLMSVLEGVGPRLFLTCLFCVTAIIGLFVSNTVTAVLMAPIALGMAKHLGVSPLPFAITLALAASSAFMTPISSPVNTLVVEPGGYRFGDFVKVGVPFTLVVLAVTVLLVPVLFPF